MEDQTKGGWDTGAVHPLSYNSHKPKTPKSINNVKLLYKVLREPIRG